jgi:hypothetical protein
MALDADARRRPPGRRFIIEVEDFDGDHDAR